MAGEANGLTLEGLAQRVESLERVNERMCSENAALRGKVATLEGSGTRRHGESEPASETSEADLEGRVSRKWLLSKAGAAAAGLVVAGALTQRDIREAKAAVPAETFISNDAATPGVTGRNTADGIGVKAEGAVGVFGDNFGSGEGVRGISSGGYGGLFSGGKAQLQLIPGGSSGSPGGGRHNKGEIYMDSGGALFVCVKGGRPGKWRKVSTTAV